MVQRASISLATGPAVIPTNDVSSGMALFLAPRAWRGPTRYVFIPRCRGLCERILKRRYKAAADRRLRCATRCRSQRNRNRESADCADPRFRATECRDGGGVLRRIRGLPLRRRSQAAGQGKGSAGGHLSRSLRVLPAAIATASLGVIQHVAQAYVAFMAGHSEPRPPPRRGCESRG